jgi:NADH-quinone oxidoreductase E subunit
MISQKTKDDILKLRKRFPQRKSAILQALHLVLKENNFVEKENLKLIAELLELPSIEVFETASFYTMFPQKKVGKYHIQVCTNLSCSLLGAEKLVKYLEEKLKIKVGETTPDGMFTLTEVECLGSCGTAPVMQVNEDYHESLTKEKVDTIIDDLKKVGTCL